MKCTNNKWIKLLCTCCVAAVFLTGCGSSKNELSHTYPVYETSLYQTGGQEQDLSFSKDLCVTEPVNFGTDSTTSQVAEGAGVFNLSTKEVCYNQNIFSRLYPASTTKIMTAYIIIQYGSLNDMVTISENAANQASDSSVCGISTGDVISVKDLLYGLMLRSGNDAAVALAEYYSGSIEAFAEVMNEEAAKLGATGTHFTNPHGLPDENHYTTVYDMYLIFKEAVKLDNFVKIINTTSVTVSYTNQNGELVEKIWNNTNRYMTGEYATPDGFTVIGGKTGTTNAAGYCLVLYSENSSGEKIVSIVFKADGRSNLYMLMNQILTGFAN